MYTCTNKYRQFNAKKTYCCKEDILQYAGKELNCERNVRPEHCAQHTKDWNICVTLLTKDFCSDVCPGEPSVYEDVFHRTHRLGYQIDMPYVEF